MTTVSDIQRQPEAPPRLEVGALGWLKHNLFGSWLDAILTLLSLGLLYITVVPAIRWAFSTANWNAVTNNILILLHGPYNQSENYRVWLSAAIIVVLGIASSFVYRTSNQRARQIMTLAWVISFPTIWLILQGFSGSEFLPLVELNKWGGLLLTFILTFVGIVFAFPLGILLALGRRSDLPIIKWICISYIELVRGVPLITVLFMGMILLPLVLPGDVRIPGIIRAMVAVTLFSAAYLAENVRGGLQSIPRGQSEAARALGLNTFQEMYLIVMPQALRAVIPPLVGQFISLFKDTTLVAIVGLLDFLKVGQSILSQAGFLGAQKEIYTFVAIVFFIFSFAMSQASIRLERRLGVGVR
jgi:general L-amino acid transport system permease protein